MATHLSFNLDGCDPKDAPGVGTPVPSGLSQRKSHLICATAAASGRLVGMELVELNPTLDQANTAGRLSVWLIESALGGTILSAPLAQGDARVQVATTVRNAMVVGA